MKRCISGILLILGSALFAQAPVVENVRFEQRTDGSLLVDIYYDVTDANSDSLYIMIEASDNIGISYRVPCWSLMGDVGRGISPGRDKHVVWDFYSDNPDTSCHNYRIRVTAFDELSGSTIKEDLTLTQDLKGSPGSGIVLNIGAPNVTLDLGGYTISGDVHNGVKWGVSAGPYEGITIKNGTIENCLFGIDLVHTDNVTVENMTIRNIEITDPDTNVIGVCVYVSEDVTIRDCQFEFLPIVHKEAVVTYHSYVIVDNIETQGGAVGVNFCGEYTPRDNGIVQNCRIVGASLAGILNQYSSSVLIKNNEITECALGITTQPGYSGAVHGMIIEGNYIYNNDIGVYFTGGTGSTFSKNRVNHNGVNGSQNCNRIGS